MSLYFMSLSMLVIILSSMATKIKIEFDGFSLSQNPVRAYKIPPPAQTLNQGQIEKLYRGEYKNAGS